MLIALDYDDTYTRDPHMWNIFVHDAVQRGHRVICCTMRYEHEGYEVVRDLGHQVEAVIFTGRKAKQKFLFDLGYNVSVWIDDSPSWILVDAQ